MRYSPLELEKMVKTYYVRFEWWNGIDLRIVQTDLSQSFIAEMNTKPSTELEMSLLKNERSELKVSAYTLTVILSKFRAVLYQKDATPFTTRDVELRKKILELYPRNSPTPFPWSYTFEPKYEIAK